MVGIVDPDTTPEEERIYARTEITCREDCPLIADKEAVISLALDVGRLSLENEGFEGSVNTYSSLED